MKIVLSGILGVLFGLILYASEVISWNRIHEMFNFESFHMYGVIGSAIVTGLILRLIAGKIGMKDIDGKALKDVRKSNGWISLLLGGTIFGVGWALTGACPGPIYIHIGAGNYAFLVVLVSALAGTVTYGLLKNKLPH